MIDDMKDNQMDNIVECAYNMDNGYVEVWFIDGNMLRIKCEEVEAALRTTEQSLAKLYRLDDLNFFSVISSEEKMRTAKDVLCYLYLLNDKHVISHLKDCGNDVTINLEQWRDDIKNRSAE